MLEKIYKSLFGDPNEKQVKKYFNEVEKIKIIEEELTWVLDSIEKVQEKTREFQAKFEWLSIYEESDKKKIKAIIEEIKHEAIAVHRIGCKLINWQEFDLWDKKFTWNMVPFDVQIVWALALNDWNISEMKTWEWKTLVATISAYLNALAGIPVHVVTVNDYLAQRDAKEMWIIYNTLWLSVWVIIHSQNSYEKQENYKRNIVYITNNELGFDYLRDNMAISKERKVIWPLYYAIVDEVDSILVDEARTPLIISAPDMEPTSKYIKFAQLAKMLKENKHFKIDEKWKTATLTEEWIQEIEKLLWVDNIYVSTHYNDIHHIENALKAETVYIKDIDYLIRNDEILIIDEHTWRVLAWRRYSDGLHQAIEAKERVTIQQESKTLASITFQNLFRLYNKLSWMTGTAKTEEEEFIKIYNLEVMVIPTNRPMIRQDKADLLFKNEKWKFEFIVDLIKEYHKAWQPILVGTVSVAKSEYLSSLLEEASIPHEVLNAKQDFREAEIISRAWHFWAVTIATNMAWRWTDIKLDDKVKWLEWEVSVAWHRYKLWWLVVIGTEKHETRRIDNQLRWRSWRQWDPWLSQFLVSPQDDIMRIFGWDKIFSIFNSKLFESVPANEPLAETRMLTSKINSVQKQVEWRNFDIRKHVLEYDDVLNHHRIAIYSRRNKILEQESVHDDLMDIISLQVSDFIEWQIEEDKIEKVEESTFAIENINSFIWDDILDEEKFYSFYSKKEIKEYIEKIIIEKIEKLKSESNESDFYDYEKKLYLQSIDELWMRHIDDMSHLREEVAYEWYAQKNPLVVYKEKAYEKFIKLINEIWFKVIKWMMNADLSQQIQQIEIDEDSLELLLNSNSGELPEELLWLKNLLSDPTIIQQDQRQEEWIRVYRAEDTNKENTNKYAKVWRNEPCPCWSWKKYKQCHWK